jgi:Fic family protein
MKPHESLIKILSATGKTQTALAQEIGVSVVTLNTWIHKKSIPRKKMQERIEGLHRRYVLDTSITSTTLLEKQRKLALYQKNIKNPFALLLSRPDIYDDFLIKMTYHTNSIEGSTFTEPNVRAVLFDDVTLRNKTLREHQEAKNHQAALGYIMNLVQEKYTTITEELIKKIHQILMNGILHNAGSYRNHGARITGSNVVTSNYISIEKHIQILIREMNTTTKNPVEHIAKTHAHFEKIHPFSDGNGRVGRLLNILLCAKYSLAPTFIIRERKMIYYDNLSQAQLHENYVPLISFMYDAFFAGYELLQDRNSK